MKTNYVHTVELPSFRDNYNTDLKNLKAQYESAQDPEKTILHMQLENGLRAFML